jgi:hypothetical protein
MSRRTPKPNQKGKPTPTPKKPRDLRRRGRWRVAIILGAFAITMLFVSLIGGLQPPMLTLYNKTGGPLTQIRVEYLGGEGRAEPVPDGGKTTLVLRPDPAAPKKPDGAPFMRLEVAMPDGMPFVIRSFVLATKPGSHEVFIARRQPQGTYEVVYQGPGGFQLSFRDILRRIGIRL